MKQNKQGVIQIAIIMLAVMALLALVSVGASLSTPDTWFKKEVKSGTKVTPGCEPTKYAAQFRGTLDLMNDMVGFLNYEITYLDGHIDNIDYKELGIVSNEFAAKVCLYDVLNGNNKIGCQSISDKVTKGRIEKFPYEFAYSMYDNDCNGEVDDHTLNLVVELNTEDGYSKNEKTVAIVNGQAVYQNAKGY